MENKNISSGKLTDISHIKELMAENGLNFKKKFGQNFLINENVPRRIADECGAGDDEGVLEIGPGIGTLTRELCRVAKKVVAVEIDTELIPILEKTLAEYDNVSVINSDIMKISLAEIKERNFPDMKVSVCANLPYYITTPVIMRLIEDETEFDNITVMVQKEVADRICASAGTENYGAITASIAYNYHARRLFTVSSGNFLPAPKVDSAVIRLERYKELPVRAESPELMFKVIKYAFAQRRKTLVNSLMSGFPQFGREKLTAAVEAVGLNADIRGECLDIKCFSALSDEILKIIDGEEQTVNI